jgi:hypothetical protein
MAVGGGAVALPLARVSMIFSAYAQSLRESKRVPMTLTTDALSPYVSISLKGLAIIIFDLLANPCYQRAVEHRQI